MQRLAIPLNGGQWDLIIEPDGTLTLANTPFPESERYLFEIGETTLSSMSELIEGINMIRSQGTSAHVH